VYRVDWRQKALMKKPRKLEYRTGASYLRDFCIPIECPCFGKSTVPLRGCTDRMEEHNED